MSYDLAVHTQRRLRVPSADYVRSVHAQIRIALDATGAPFELTAHQLRGARAKWFLENDGLLDAGYRSAFEEFCRQEQISSEPLTENSALSFMVHHDGAHLATVGLPRDDASCAAVFRALVDFARAHGLRLVDPQAGVDIDLESPGQYPPLWAAGHRPPLHQ